MYDLYNQRLAEVDRLGLAALLGNGLMGLEKEALRVVRESGRLSQAPHPPGLGSALTHPHITTDYSEALLELITSPHARSSAVLAELDEINRAVYSQLRGEVLWAASMPCIVDGETSIPIAEYGSSNSGMMKHVYRRGLAWRYGKTMQVIAGVHFNHSFGEALWPALGEITQRDDLLRDKSAAYMALTRNLLRLGWLVPYLFGASPAVCKSFFGDKASPFSDFDSHTAYEPYATSLRLSDIGYQNNREAELGINIDYSSLPRYIETMRDAITRPHAEYERIGVKAAGEYRQLNANLLQIENEYYSIVRAKEIAQRLEKPTTALERRGIRYIELRSLDVSPFEPLGVSAGTMHFLKLLMTFCLLQDSPPLSDGERHELRSNLQETAVRGRDPDLELLRCSNPIALRDWAAELLREMQGLAELLDQDCAEGIYTAALAEQRQRVEDPDSTPSARVLREMRDNSETYYAFAMRWSLRHSDDFTERPDDGTLAKYARMAEQSHRDQAAMEAADEIDFDTFLAQYFATESRRADEAVS